MIGDKNNATVLVVDDRPSNLLALEAILEPLGYPVMTVQSGKEALRALLTCEVALILPDIDMPTMDGLETARMIRSRERTQAIPIIFVTGKGADDPAFMDAYRIGAVDFLSKPVHPEVLRSKVAVFAELYRQRDHIRKQSELLREHEQAALRLDLERKHLVEMQRLADRERSFIVDVLSSVTEGRLRLCNRKRDLPSRGAQVARPVALRECGALRLLREQVRIAADVCGVPDDRCHDLLTAVSEAGMNALVHASGGSARFYQGAGGGVQAWVKDRGPGITMDKLPRATLQRGFSTAGTLGHGFWLMLSTADRLFLYTQPGGTTIVIEQEQSPPGLSWQ
jgi:CheY-like chemotaxis protein/anti-sigma regulatory factor (Ser/Thr protein kinase)